MLEPAAFGFCVVVVVVGTVVVDPLEKIFRKLPKKPGDFVVVK